MEGTQEEVRYTGVFGYEGYRVGTDGSVWTSWRKKTGPVKNKEGIRTVIGDSWRQMRQTKNTHGYPCVCLYKNKKGKLHPVHRIVMLSFCGPKPEGMEVAHGNGKRDDNRLSNLSWKTHKDNISDRKKHGTEARGSRNGFAKLTEEKVYSMKRDIESGETNKTKLGIKYGISRHTVGLIVSGKRWKHVT
jgi:hypothetical protein